MRKAQGRGPREVYAEMRLKGRNLSHGQKVGKWRENTYQIFSPQPGKPLGRCRGEVLRPEKAQLLSSLSSLREAEWWEMRRPLLKGLVCHAKNFKFVCASGKLLKEF